MEKVFGEMCFEIFSMVDIFAADFHVLSGDKSTLDTFISIRFYLIFNLINLILINSNFRRNFIPTFFCVN